MAPSIDFIANCPEPLDPWPELLDSASTASTLLAGSCWEEGSFCQVPEHPNAEGTHYLIVSAPDSTSFSILVSGFPLYQCPHCLQQYFPVEEVASLEQRLADRISSKRPVVSVPYWTLRYDPESLSA